jgi:hypothetical protein
MGNGMDHAGGAIFSGVSTKTFGVWPIFGFRDFTNNLPSMTRGGNRTIWQKNI